MATVADLEAFYAQHRHTLYGAGYPNPLDVPAKASSEVYQVWIFVEKRATDETLPWMYTRADYKTLAGAQKSARIHATEMYERLDPVKNGHVEVYGVVQTANPGTAIGKRIVSCECVGTYGN